MLGVPNLAHNIMTKYHEAHTYENCRLLKITDNISVDIWKSMLNKDGLNLLCVAAHYSNRYGNSENYFTNKQNEFVNYTLYLKNNSQQTIMDQFCSHSLETVLPPPVSTPPNVAFGVTSFSINWKNMHFIWKQYISHHSYPSMIYSNTLKSLLKERYNYDETTDTFCNVTSKFLPYVGDFIHFWEKTIVIQEPEPEPEPGLELGPGLNYFDNEIEIDELCDLFAKWARENGDSVRSNGTINEHDVLKILSHFFPLVNVIDNKYIVDVTSTMWNKVEDIKSSLDLYKASTSKNNTDESNSYLISFDVIYDAYCAYCYNKTNKATKFVISKLYFEKYVRVLLAPFVEFDTFLSSKWLQE